MKIPTVGKSKHIHRDKLGRELVIGDCVAVTHRNDLQVAKIVSLLPKMVKVEMLNVNKFSWYTGEHNKYGEQMVVIDNEYVTMYLLKAQL